MYGNVVYAPRSIYAKREEMLSRHADLVAGTNGSVIWFGDILHNSFAAQKTEEESSVLTTDSISSSRMMTHTEKHPKKVVIINEGAGDFAALLGVIRLVEYMSQTHIFGKEQPLKIVVDSGTGTTAVGLALGSLCLGLPWEIHAVMLADTVEGYEKQEKRLIFDFKRYLSSQKVDQALSGAEAGIVHWVERDNPRKFGNVLKGEIETCREIAQQTGILLDPVYTLAAWEQATNLCQKEAKQVVMLHTGGTLGMFGLAQRSGIYAKLARESMEAKQKELKDKNKIVT